MLKLLSAVGTPWTAAVSPLDDYLHGDVIECCVILLGVVRRIATT